MYPLSLGGFHFANLNYSFRSLDFLLQTGRLLRWTGPGLPLNPILHPLFLDPPPPVLTGVPLIVYFLPSVKHTDTMVPLSLRYCLIIYSHMVLSAQATSNKQVVLEVYTINYMFIGFKPQPGTRHFLEVLSGK